MLAKCKKNNWDGARYYYAGKEYDIDPKSPAAIHFDFPKKTKGDEALEKILETDDQEVRGKKK